jgi:streptogramin lyase
MLPRPATRALALAAFLLAVSAAPALAAPAVSGEFAVSGLDSNNKLVEGPDGNEWLTLSSATADVARISTSGEVTEYDLGAEAPSGIAVAAGKLWITRNGGITSFETKDPVLTKDPIAIPAITGISSIVSAADGNLWVATAGNLVRILPTEPKTNKAFEVLGLAPKDIDVAGSLLVIADFNGKRVLTATTGDPPVTSEVKLADSPQGVAGGPGGQVAYTQPTNEPKEIGLFTPPSLSPLKLPLPGTDAFGIALGLDGAYWSAEGNGDRLLRITTTGQVSDLKGFAALSRPTQLATGPGGTLWVALSMASKVGRVSGVEAPPVAPPASGGSGGSGGGGSSSGTDQPLHPAPETEILSGPGKKSIIEGRKMRAAFRFASPQAGAGFECRLVRIVKKKGKGKAKSSAEPAFRACTSPRVYRLTPGRYRFEVRAVLDGIPDPTRAKRPFRIVRAR